MLQLQKIIIQILNVVWIVEMIYRYRKYWNKNFSILFLPYFKNATIKFKRKRSLCNHTNVYMYLSLSLSVLFSTRIIDNLQLKFTIYNYFLQFFSFLSTRLMSTLRHFQFLLLSDLNVTIYSQIFFYTYIYIVAKHKESQILRWMWSQFCFPSEIW